MPTHRRSVRAPLRHRPVAAATLVLVATTLAASVGVVGAGATAPRHRATATATATAPAYTWPKFSYDNGDQGLSPDPTVSTANASTLGVRWMAPSGTTSYSSPVVAWAATIKKTLVYLGNENGDLTAYDEATGATVWSADVGSAIRGTPLVANGSVYVTPNFSPHIYEFNAATGALECESPPMVSTAETSLTSGPGPGGKPTVYAAVNDLAAASGPLYAMDEATCHFDWQFTGYDSIGGSWAPLSYGTTATGEHVVLVGTSDLDSTEYAVDASTGAKVWSFATIPLANDFDIDIGAGATVSAPGVNGFADGVAYVPSKDGYLFALDLTTGALLWKLNFGAVFGVGNPFSRSTAALTGTSLIFGGMFGVASVDAVTGAVQWQTAAAGGGEVLCGVSIVGPPGRRVVAVTSQSGELSVLDETTGALLYSHQMGYDSTSSVADTDGNLLTTSSDGFLYDYALGGSNGTAPTTTVTGPAYGSTLPNPGGDVTITGTASGSSVTGVDVAVQSGGPDGPWWNATTQRFTPGYFNDPATLASPGAATTTWSLALPVPPAGGTYTVQAFAVDADGLADTSADQQQDGPSRDAFTVTYLATAPHLTLTGGTTVAPGASLAVGGSGFGAGETVQLALGTASLGSVTADGSGSFAPTGLTVPANLDFGETSLVATGATSGLTTSVAVDVSNQWPGQSYDSLHTAYEPDDTVLDHHQSADNPRFLIQAWSYSTGAAISTAPAVVDNVAFVGDASGTVTALDVHHSVPLWTASAGSAVTGSPLVADGRVLVGTSAGTVAAFDQTTGAPVWSYSVGAAADAAPTLAGADVIVAGSSGTVAELSVATGAPVWTVVLHGAVVASPAVDTAKGLVAVSAGNGVTALSLFTGATLWAASTKGAVTADPSITDGEVLVGSSDGSVYAWHETTGGTVWTYATGAPVTAGGAVINSAYVAGNGSGTVDYLTQGTGKLVKAFDAGSAVVGLAAAEFFLVVTTSSGIARGYKYVGETAWTYQSTKGFAAPAAVVDGIVYLTGLDTTVSAFTIPGRPVP